MPPLTPPTRRHPAGSLCYLTAGQKAELLSLLSAIQNSSEQGIDINEELAREHDQLLSDIYSWFEVNAYDFMTTDPSDLADD